MKSKLRIVDVKTEGDVAVLEHTQFNNLKAENVIVHEGVQTRLFGSVSNEFTIKKGAKVILHGSIKGKINNEGGELLIYN